MSYNVTNWRHLISFLCGMRCKKNPCPLDGGQASVLSSGDGVVVRSVDLLNIVLPPISSFMSIVETDDDNDDEIDRNPDPRSVERRTLTYLRRQPGLESR